MPLFGCCRPGFRPAACTQQVLPLLCRKPTPDPVGLWGVEGVLAAFGDDRALMADRYGYRVTAAAARAALSLGMEEDGGGLGTAGTELLPLPPVVHSSGKPAVIRHVGSPPRSVFSRWRQPAGQEYRLVCAGVNAATGRRATPQRNGWPGEPGCRAITHPRRLTLRPGRTRPVR